MTAVNACVLDGGNGAILLTDTVMFDDYGIVQAFSAKVVTLPHKQMAIAIRGDAGTLNWAAAIADGFDDFDAFRAGSRNVYAKRWLEYLDGTSADLHRTRTVRIAVFCSGDKMFSAKANAEKPSG